MSGPRWLHIHEYIKAYRGTVSLAIPVESIRRFGVNEDGSTWIDTERELHVVTESFDEIWAAVTAPEWKEGQ